MASFLSTVDRVLLNNIGPAFGVKFDPEPFITEKQRIIDQQPLEDETLEVFFKDAEEIRAEPELGGLGPGLFGEYTKYSFVVARNEKRWIVEKRFSQFYTLDQQLLQAIKDNGGDESKLPEVIFFSALYFFLDTKFDQRQFPEKQMFGKMSPSLVKQRQKQLETYLKEVIKDPDLCKEPMLRIFLKIPMNSEQVQELDKCSYTGDGLLTGYGGYKSLFQRTREEKKKGIHHTQKKEMFAGPPTLAGASEVGEAFAETSQHDKKQEKKWIFRIPIISDFGGQTVKDIFGSEVRGLHSTYNAQIKEQVEKHKEEVRNERKAAKTKGGETTAP